MRGARLCEPWPMEGCCDLASLAVAPAVTGLAYEAASEILWLATGQRFGNCVVHTRPCRRDCAEQLTPPPFPAQTIAQVQGGAWNYPWPTLLDGAWLNIGCGSCLGDCSCTSTSEVLFDEPIRSIELVTVDGVDLPPSSWHLYNEQRLVRTDGGVWPFCQDWTVTGGPGTWSVDLIVGEDVPALGKLAVGKLTCEIAKACAGVECELPPYITQVTRQGVTMTAAADFLDEKGLTGVFLADMFIKRVNPHKIMDRARAYSPDRSYV